MFWVQLDETVAGGDGGNRLIVCVISIGNFQLRLLGIASVGVACFQRLEVFDGFFIEVS